MITNSGNINRIIIKAVIKLLLLLLLLLLFNKLICQNVFKSPKQIMTAVNSAYQSWWVKQKEHIVIEV